MNICDTTSGSHIPSGHCNTADQTICCFCFPVWNQSFLHWCQNCHDDSIAGTILRLVLLYDKRKSWAFPACQSQSRPLQHQDYTDETIGHWREGSTVRADGPYALDDNLSASGYLSSDLRNRFFASRLFRALTDRSCLSFEIYRRVLTPSFGCYEISPSFRSDFDRLAAPAHSFLLNRWCGPVKHYFKGSLRMF